MTASLRSLGGLARSLAVYRARPWKIGRLASFYAGFVRPGDLAFDVGAHVGNRTRALLRAGARVVALEPQSLFHAFLRRDLPREVTLLPMAAGAREGEAELAVSRLHPTVSSLAVGFADRMGGAPGFGRVRWDATETVEVITLDALIAEFGRPRFVKIDVEGYEPEVLAGLSTPVPWLAFESLPGQPEAAQACVARLAGLCEHEFNLVDGERGGFALRDWTGAAEIVDRLAARGPRARPADVYARWRDAPAG